MVVPINIRERIRDLPALACAPDDVLDRILQDGMLRGLEPKEVFIVEGEVARVAYLIVEGAVEIVRSTAGSEVVVATRGAGELVGEMGLLMAARRNATVRASTPALVLEISAPAFESILVARPEMAIAMVRTVWERLQAAEAHLVQHQKMAALGTLAAGLAHELNNPAAALLRSTGQLAGTVFDWERRAGTLGASLSESETRHVAELRRELEAGDGRGVALDPVELADREEALNAWLAARAVDDARQLASLLVDSGQTLEGLERVASVVRAEHLGGVLRWLADGALVHRLLGELAISARAISEIVTAVKGYTRLDQAPIQELDIHEGIEQALVILRHKLRGIQVRRDYAADLPQLSVYAGELNQVWANLIDNAADAMQGQGTLAIRTRLESGAVIVEIEDDGPGIPQTAQTSIFDPFFTTKPPGQGTGLGLAISFNVVRKHRGDMRVQSEPGRTCFRVQLPVANGIY